MFDSLSGASVPANSVTEYDYVNIYIFGIKNG